MDVSPTVFEILTFNARKWFVFPPLPCLTTPLGGNPLEFLDETPQKLEGRGYRMVKIS